MTTTTDPRHEFTGKTVDDCLAAATAALGVPADDLDIEILSEPGSLTSLFGKKARIAARVKGPSMADRIADGLRFDADILADRDAEPVLRTRSTEAQPAPRQRPAESRPAPRPRPVEARPAPRPRPVDAPPAPRTPAAPVPPGTFDPRESLWRIASVIMPEVEVRAEEQGDLLILEIVGDGSGVFIGRKGTTLEALQFLLNRMAQKGGWEGKRIVVDSENYRDRRVDSLRDKARELAERVLAEHRPLRTEMLDAASRKVVHSEIQNFPELRTRSIGEGDHKRVQISFGDAAPPRRRGRR